MCDYNKSKKGGYLKCGQKSIERHVVMNDEGYVYFCKDHSVNREGKNV